MNVNFQVRPVTARDAAALQETCWPEKSLDAIRELIQRAEGMARRGRGLGIVADVNSSISGYAQLTIWPRVAEISDLIVTEHLREQGIGSALIRYLIEEARQVGMKQIEIGVALTNRRAYRLYQRLGFGDDRLVNLDLGHGPEAVMYLVMELSDE